MTALGTDDDQNGDALGGPADMDTGDIQDTADGGAIVTLAGQDDDKGTGPDEQDVEQFYRNLADEDLAEDDMDELACKLLELIKVDKEARAKRDEQYEEGLRRTGLGKDAPGGAQFQGASKVVHPMMTEACVDFASRAIKELFPANGPVKTKIIGRVTRPRVEKARRKADFMNWQLTTQSTEFRAELEQTLTQVPMGGAGYIRCIWNRAKNRPDFMFIGVDEIYLPFVATNFYTATRKTHAFTLTDIEIKKRMASGQYRDIELPSSSMTPEGSKAAKANAKIEGKEDNQPTNQDGERLLYDVYVETDIEGDPEDADAADDAAGEDDEENEGGADEESAGDDDSVSPYIVTIDVTSQKVLAVYRNWDMDDPDAREELDWIIEFPFVPWRGAMPIGLPHMIGGLSGAATGALRALLDSAHINNAASLLKLKGGSRGGQSLTIQPTQVEEIEGGINVDDIRKLAMPLPFNPPSMVLYQLLGFMVDSARSVIRTTFDDMSENNQNVPVGTTLARIEQGMVVFSAIHARLHNAMERLLGVLHRLNGWNLDDTATEREIGEIVASRDDFEGPRDVVPVSDPNIFSEAQRFAQIQAVAQRQQANPAMYDARKVEERILETLKIPDPMDLLAKQTTPVEENLIAENVKMSLGQPVVAFPEQNHIAHLKGHLAFLVSKVLGQSPLIAPSLQPRMMQHLKEHIVMWYAQEAFEMADAHAKQDKDGFDLQAALEQFHDLDTPTKQAIDMATAEAGMNVSIEAEQVFGTPEFEATITKALAYVQSLTPPPQDPAAAAAMADVQMRGQAAAAKDATEKQKVQARVQEKQIDVQAEQARLSSEATAEDVRQQHEDHRAQERDTVDVEMNDADNRTALEIAEMKDGGSVPSVRPAAPNPNPNSNPTPRV